MFFPQNLRVPAVECRIQIDDCICLQFRHGREYVLSPESEEVIHAALLYRGIALYPYAVGTEFHVCPGIDGQSGYISPESAYGYGRDSVPEESDP